MTYGTAQQAEADTLDSKASEALYCNRDNDYTAAHSTHAAFFCCQQLFVAAV